MVKKVTFVGFRGAIAPFAPPGSTPVCKFVKKYRVEAWKILRQKPSGFFQEPKATIPTKYFTVSWVN